MFEVLYEKDDDRLYIVLEYCDAGSLDCMIRRCVCLSCALVFVRALSHFLARPLRPPPPLPPALPPSRPPALSPSLRPSLSLSVALISPTASAF